ncbi:MAG: dihydroneopterin aldolase [Balneola sp.]|nr:MAG: dihydroneopterin aldolase [Balneola sp.]
MDKLVLKGLKFRGYHGFYDKERVDGNDFEVDLTFHLSLEDAGVSDELEKTIDYSIAQKIVAEVIEGKSKKLIEHLAYLIGECLTNEIESANSVEVTLRKLNPPMPGICEYSEVTLSWPR